MLSRTVLVPVFERLKGQLEYGTVVAGSQEGYETMCSTTLDAGVCSNRVFGLAKQNFSIVRYPYIKKQHDGEMWDATVFYLRCFCAW